MRTAATWTGMRALPDNRFVGRFRRRSWRRALVVAFGISIVLSVALASPNARAAAPWGWRLAGLAAAGISLLIALATRNVSNTIDAFADERDRERRDRTHRIAYWILALPLGMGAGLLGTRAVEAAERGEPLVLAHPPHIALTLAIVAMASIAYATLPSALLAWTEPDPPEDEHHA